MVLKLTLICRPEELNDNSTTIVKMKPDSGSILFFCAISIVAMIVFCCCYGHFTAVQDVVSRNNSPKKSMVGLQK